MAIRFIWKEMLPSFSGDVLWIFFDKIDLQYIHIIYGIVGDMSSYKYVN